jgi:hypothetical protein
VFFFCANGKTKATLEAAPRNEALNASVEESKENYKLNRQYQHASQEQAHKSNTG